MHARVFGTIAFLIIATLAANAKCPVGELTVSGDIVSANQQFPHVVEINLDFRDGRDELLVRPQVRDGKFDHTFTFGTQTRYNGLEGHVCNHRPKMVVVRLLSERRMVDERRFDQKFLRSHEELSLIRVRLNADQPGLPEIQKSPQACIPKAVRQKFGSPRSVNLRPGEIYRGGPLIRFVIAEDGTVREVELVRSSGIRLIDEREVAAIRTWRYNARPACGVIELTMYITIDFR